MCRCVSISLMCVSRSVRICVFRHTCVPVRVCACVCVCVCSSYIFVTSVFLGVSPAKGRELLDVVYLIYFVATPLRALDSSLMATRK